MNREPKNKYINSGNKQTRKPSNSNTIKQSMEIAAELKTSIAALNNIIQDVENNIKASKDRGNIEENNSKIALKIIGGLNEYLKIINNNMYNITERIARLESIVVGKDDLIKNLVSLYPLIFPPSSQSTAAQQQQQQTSSSAMRPGQSYPR